MTIATKDKVMENRLRRKANRMGLKLVKSRRRDPDALDFGCYALCDLDHNVAVFGFGPFGTPFATIEDVREYLSDQT